MVTVARPSRANSPNILPLLLVGAGCAVYFATLTFPLINQRSWLAHISADTTAQLKGQAQVGVFTLLVCFAIAAVQSAKWITYVARPNSIALTGWVVLSCWYFATVFWSINPQNSMIYTLLVGAVLAAGVIFWTMPDRIVESAALVSAVTVVAGLGYLALNLPITTRSIGAIEANLIGHFGLALIVLAYLARRLRWLFVPIGLLLIVHAQSRTVFMALAVFFMAYHLVLPRLHSEKAVWRTIVLGGLALLVMALFGETLLEHVTDALNSLFGITDAKRGASSGLTGRTIFWRDGIDLLTYQLLQGYGFRTRGGILTSDGGHTFNAHSGVLNAFLDGGLIGGLIFLALVLGGAVVLIRYWAKYRQPYQRTMAAFLAGMLIILMVEPNYLNLAHPTSFLFMLAISATLVRPREVLEAQGVAPPALRRVVAASR